MGMGAAVTFVMALTALVAWSIQTYILDPLQIQYMQTIVFILVIAALVQMVEIMLKKTLAVALGARYLPAAHHDQLRRAGRGDPNDPEGVHAVAERRLFGLHGPGLRAGAGAFRRYPPERLELEDVPESFRGTPIALVTAGILAMAFMGFSGLV